MNRHILMGKLAAFKGGVDAYTKSLLHMDGADASTTFTDVYGITWTANGNAQIDTAQSKFGGASGLFDGTGDYISTPYTTAHNTGAGNFTYEGWWRFNSVAADFHFVARRTSDGGTTKDYNGFQWASPDTGYLTCKVNEVMKLRYSFTWTPLTNTWYHLAYVRSGSTILFFIDGVSQVLTEATAVGTNNLDPTYGSPLLVIGRRGDADDDYLNGWVDDFRYSVGIARYTANFTPPNEPHWR